MYCAAKTDTTPTGATSAGVDTTPADATPTGAITIDTTFVPHPPVPHPPVPLPQLPYTDSNGILGQQNITMLLLALLDLGPRVLLVAEKRRKVDVLLCNNRLQ